MTADNIIFDDRSKIFEILNGSIGKYDYNDVLKSQVVYENARHKGKYPMFSQRMLISTFNSLLVDIKKVYIGVEIKLKDQNIYVYICDKPLQQHTLEFKDIQAKADKINKHLKEIAKDNL